MNQASSDLCTVFGSERPIFQAGMGYVTSGRIAGIVSILPAAELVDLLAAPAEAS